MAASACLVLRARRSYPRCSVCWRGGRPWRVFRCGRAHHAGARRRAQGHPVGNGGSSAASVSPWSSCLFSAERCREALVLLGHRRRLRHVPEAQAGPEHGSYAGHASRLLGCRSEQSWRCGVPDLSSYAGTSSRGGIAERRECGAHSGATAIAEASRGTASAMCALTAGCGGIS